MTTGHDDHEVTIRMVHAKAFPTQTITAPVALGAPIAVLDSGIGPEPDRGGCHQPEIIGRDHPQQLHLPHTATPTTSPTPIDKQARTPPSKTVAFRLVAEEEMPMKRIYNIKTHKPITYVSDTVPTRRLAEVCCLKDHLYLS